MREACWAQQNITDQKNNCNAHKWELPETQEESKQMAVDRDYIMLKGHMWIKGIRSIWDTSGKSPFIEIHSTEGNAED